MLYGASLLSQTGGGSGGGGGVAYYPPHPNPDEDFGHGRNNTIFSTASSSTTSTEEDEDAIRPAGSRGVVDGSRLPKQQHHHSTEATTPGSYRIMHKLVHFNDLPDKKRSAARLLNRPVENNKRSAGGSSTDNVLAYQQMTARNSAFLIQRATGVVMDNAGAAELEEETDGGAEDVWEKFPKHDCQVEGCERVTVNVSGMIFETRIGVLNRHPRTLLGKPHKRSKYYDSERKEYFFDRHRPTFEAIFHYYQFGGKLKRPIYVPDEIFLSELEFYEIEKEVVDTYKRDEGYVIDNVVLPDNLLQRKIWMLFEFPETSAIAFIIAISSVIFTIISIFLFCIETLPVFSESHCVAGEAPNFNDVFFILETTCTFWFTVEVIVRLITCPSKKDFIKDFKNVVDVAAIVPYYVTLANVLISFSCEGAKSSASLAFLRVIRLIRVFKLTKHSPGLQVLILTFRASIEGLGLFLVALIVCILVFSSTIYYVEVGIKDSQIESIPDAFWWAIITMCTVGYGDKVPKGLAGKLVGSVCALAGVLTLAIPVPIITENFNKFYTHKTGRGRNY